MDFEKTKKRSVELFKKLLDGEPTHEQSPKNTEGEDLPWNDDVLKSQIDFLDNVIRPTPEELKKLQEMADGMDKS